MAGWVVRLSRWVRQGAGSWRTAAMAVAGCGMALLAAATETSPLVTRTPLRENRPDPLAVRPLNPNFDLFPDSSLADFSGLLDAPAGKRGFVKRDGEGRLVYGDGTRARFWGVVITQEHIDIPKERIDVVVDVLARAGCNMVRFHSLDNRAGYEYGFIRRTIIDDAPPHDRDTQHFDAEYRDRLDYWIAKLKERGIYSFIVLRAFRHYREGDEVENYGAVPRGGRPMAFFNQRLIDLQVQFARDLLFEQVNPYTKLPYGKDPAVALVELFNEDSLFSRPDAWHKMPEPYLSEFQTLWMDYLKRSYGSTEKLRQAWTNVNGLTALGAGESLEGGSVALPDISFAESFEAAQKGPYDDAKRSPVRRRDALRFAIELQREYFRTMDKALKEMGLEVPMTGVVAGGVLPDTFSAAQDLGFTAENMYQEHPSFEPGREWLPPYYYPNENYLRSGSVHSGLPFVMKYRWGGVPLSVREWAAGWPNQYRASSMLEMAAYARFQDLDAILYFAYYTTGDFTRLGPFTLGNDPTRWGMFGVAAQAFLGEDTISPAQRTIEIGCTAEDLSALGDWTEAVYQLSWVHGLKHVLMTPESKPSSDLLLTAGRSHDVGHRGDFGLIRSGAAFVTSSQHEVATGANTVWAKSGYRLDGIPAGNTALTFDGTGFDNGVTTAIPGALLFPMEQLENQRLYPIGKTEDGTRALGGYHELRKNMVLGSLPTEHVPRFAVDLMHHLFDTPMTHKDLDAGLFLADTGELVRDAREGRLFIDTARIQAIQGQFTTGTAVETPSGTLRVNSLSPVGAVAVVSLDGRTLSQARQLLVKMVTVAENRKQLLEPATHPAMKGTFVMTTEGGAPIVTNGRPAADGFTTVELAGKPLIAAGLLNGTWEALINYDSKTVYLSCDTPNSPFQLSVPPEAPAEQFSLTRYQNETPDPHPAERVGREFVYPGWAKVAALTY